MLISFLAVSQQVLVLFILILIGFICSKCRFFTPECIAGIVKFILYVVTPCVIINSFHRDFNKDLLFELIIALLAATGSHIINIIFAHIFIRDKNKRRESVLRFGTVFTNCGYMALPLQEALLGSDGVFFGAAFIAVFNILGWTYGLMIMSGSKEKISIKKIILNPGVLGVIAGLVVFTMSIKIPAIPLSAIKNLAALNTPLPMIVIGYYLSGITSLSVLKDLKLCISLVLRLIITPVLTLIILHFLGLKGVLFTATIICESAPTAANTVMFASMCDTDTKLAGTLVTTTTLFSVITMPLIVALSMSL